MTIAAVIAEFNPFHNGHAYLAKMARELTGADFVIAIMSGDYVQRGVPAIVDRETRCRMALAAGYDLVLAYPTRFASASAECFAAKAVEILSHLGCVDYLVFGSENGDLTALNVVADTLSDEPPTYKEALRRALKNGLSFPTARALALEEALTSDSSLMKMEHSDVATLLSTPNNILALEYLKAIKRLKVNIKPVTITRAGQAYHDEALPDDDTQMPSASAIRAYLEAITSNGCCESSRIIYRTTDTANAAHTNISGGNDKHLNNTLTGIPAEALTILEADIRARGIMHENDLSPILAEKLWSLTCPEDLMGIADMTVDLGNAIFKKRQTFTDFAAFAEVLKSKNLTRTRINRALLHLTLGIRAQSSDPNGTAAISSVSPVMSTGSSSEPESSESLNRNPVGDGLLYAQILGFRKDKAALLKTITAQTDIPVITRPADGPALLTGEALALFREEERVTNLYESLRSMKSGQAMRPALSRPVIVFMPAEP
ncbi:MAG: nucleotidyltransferase family protein [Lachnospiraceae bacterium]|nr:nucleotidyltransferase family protein [Lachnospiraceae bacterium]